MHTFQPYPIEALELNPFTKLTKDWSLLTTGNKAKANTMTANWGGMGVMWNKNSAFVFVRDSRYTKELMDQNDFFTISFMDESMHSIMEYLGSASGRDEDKIAKSGLNINYFRGIPYIDESHFVVVCKKLSCTRITPDNFCDSTIDKKWYTDGDMHNMYIGEIIEVLAR